MRLVDADREAEQAYEFRQRAGLARSLQEHGLASLRPRCAPVYGEGGSFPRTPGIETYLKVADEHDDVL